MDHPAAAPSASHDLSDAPEPESTPIGDVPDWRYLLREVYELYRFTSSGGSAPIRAHQRAVREAINRALKSQPRVVLDPPHTL
ncbi:MAG: hypothetical protein AAF618_14295, partial [Pseudomonadota bacterium]